MVIWLYMDGVNSGVSEEKTTTPVNDGVGDKALISDGVVGPAPGKEQADNVASDKKQVDDVTLVKEHVDDTASVKERAGESRENRALVITLCVLGVMIVGLIVAIAVVNVTKGVGTTNNMRTVVVKNSNNGLEEGTDAYAVAMIFSNDVFSELQTNPKYDLEQASYDYSVAIDEAEGDLKFYLALNYVEFAILRLNDDELVASMLEEIKPVATSSPSLASAYYFGLSQAYRESGDEVNADYYNKKFENVLNYYWDWSNYEEE